MISYVSNVLCYLSMGGEVAFDYSQMTIGQLSVRKIADAINALVPHFYRIIGDTAEVEVGDTVGFSFTPRIEGGSYSQAEFSHIKNPLQETCCKLYHVGPLRAGLVVTHSTRNEYGLELDRYPCVGVRCSVDNGEPPQQVLWMGAPRRC